VERSDPATYDALREELRATRHELRQVRSDFVELERKVRRLEDDALRAATTADVRRELGLQTAELERRRERGRARAFGRREKLWALGIAAALLVANVLELVLHVTGTG
jgi:predicted  nucleic acid-binding Zn-ribbon protein